MPPVLPDTDSYIVVLPTGIVALRYSIERVRVRNGRMGRRSAKKELVDSIG